MKFCIDHWNALRAEIDKAGLSGFVADSGEKAASNLVKEAQDGEVTIDTFDPLMGAHNMILVNAMDMIARVGADPLEMLYEGSSPEHQCPICFLNFLSRDHDERCNDSRCSKTPGQTFDEWIEYAVGGQLEVLRGLRGN